MPLTTMNKIYKSLLAATLPVFAVGLTGCVEETFPTSTVSQEQVLANTKAAEAYASGMPAYLNTVFVVPNDRHYDFGYPSMMHLRDVMTGDMAVVASGYDQFANWEKNTYQGEEYIFSQMIWWFYSKLIQTTNLTLGAIDKSTENKHLQALMGQAYAFRAFAYLDAARMYEYLPTDGTSPITPEGNDVTNYTLSITTEETSEEDAKSNPRVKRDVMFEFIMSDLDNAEKFIVAEARSSKTMPDLSVVYGLKARAYMWVEDYANAKTYARKAIDTAKGATVLTEQQWLSTTTGFNDLSTPSWLWGQQYVLEDNAVQTGIINWTSWSSNEYIPGYSAGGPYIMIDASLYNKINNTDFRKRSFVAPQGHPLSGKEVFIDKDALLTADPDNPVKIASTPYSSLKIRPGKGNMLDYTKACVVGVPLMRVEEMYFIEAEAAAQITPAEGKTLIESFMTQYRDPQFTVVGSTKEQVVDAIFTQKRMEFFCEGLIMFDYKRLNKPVIRNYEGSNYQKDRDFNTTTRPAWMNYVFVRQEADSNPAFKGWNNPDPTGCYKATEAE